MDNRSLDNKQDVLRECVSVDVYVLRINPKWTMNVKRNKLEMTINEQVLLALRDLGVTHVCESVCTFVCV